MPFFQYIQVFNNQYVLCIQTSVKSLFVGIFWWNLKYFPQMSSTFDFRLVVIIKWPLTFQGHLKVKCSEKNRFTQSGAKVQSEDKIFFHKIKSNLLKYILIIQKSVARWRNSHKFRNWNDFFARSPSSRGHFHTLRVPKIK